MKSYDEICKSLNEVQKDKKVGLIKPYELRRFKLLFDKVYSNGFLKKVTFFPKDVRKVSDNHYYSWCTTIDYDCINGFSVKRHEGQGINNYHGYGFFVEYICPEKSIPIILNLVNDFVSDWEEDVKCLKFDKESECFIISFFIKYTRSPKPDLNDLTPLEKIFSKRETE